MSVLPDVLRGGLKVVFCGTAASAKSAQVGAYYAGPGNRFWDTLYQTGITPHPLRPAEFRRVLDYGIGLTDIAKHASGGDVDLRNHDFDAPDLLRRIEYFAPAALAFNGKRAAQMALGQKSVEYGWQTGYFGPARAIILPSTSGAARAFWTLGWWQALADWMNQDG